MFQKLNITLPELDLTRLQGNKISEWGDSLPDFREYEVKNIQYFLDACKDVVKFIIPPDHVNITVIEKFGAVVPHTDAWPVALNVYLSVGADEITTFYNNPSNHKIALEESSELFTYDIDKLTEAGNFSAKTNDCYLLNTHQPHAVSNQHNGSRTILRLIWLKFNFNTILKSIKIL
jgi:hypothetical protein